MSERKRRSELLFSSRTAHDHDDVVLEDLYQDVPQMNDSKRIRKINPLGMRVVVGIKKDTNVSDGGLYLPEGSKQNMQESLLAEVIEVASAVDESTQEETNVSGIPLGALVLLPKTAGTKIPWDENLRIVETKEILAVVHEVSVT